MIRESDSILNDLRQDGYAVQRDVLSTATAEAMADRLDWHLAHSANTPAVSVTDAQRMIFNVHYLDPDVFMSSIDIDAVMHVMDALFHDRFILSNFNGTMSNTRGGAGIHIDSRVPMTDFDSTFQAVALLCLDDFTAANGATLVWPGSHRSGSDPRSLRGETRPPGSVAAEAPRGSVIYTLGQTWHDVGPNLSGDRRWGIIAYYARWWVKPTFDFVAGCTPALYASMTARQKELCGFTSRPPAALSDRFMTVTSVDDLPGTLDEARARG